MCNDGICILSFSLSLSIYIYQPGGIQVGEDRLSGRGSDTPWAVGPAICFKHMFILLLYRAGLHNHI